MKRIGNWLLVLAVAASTAGAEDLAGKKLAYAPGADLGDAELRIQDGSIHLTLEEAIGLAVERNLGIEVERYSVEQAHLGIQQAMGIYDLGLSAGLSVSSSTSPSASNLQGADVQEQKARGFDIGLSQLTPTGGTAGLSFDASRFETNNSFYSINPSFSSNFGLSFGQPLLNGFGRATTEYRIATARGQSAQAKENFLVTVDTTVQQVINGYWTLLEAQEQLKVAEEGLALAKQLHEMNRVRVDVGTLAPLELVQSEAGVATREEEIIRAHAAIGDAEDQMRALLHLEGDQAWSMPIAADTDPRTDRVDADLQTSLHDALAQRPELAAQREVQKNLELGAAFAAQDLKPRLDLLAKYGSTGVGGDVIVRDPDTGEVLQVLPGGLSDAFKQVRKFDFTGWSVGLQFAYPLQNRAARARKTTADLAVDQGATRVRQLEQQVSTEVRTAVRGLDTAQKQIESAAVSRRLEERNLEAEQKKYENGLSTSFQVLSIQDDLTAAKSREVTAITGYRRALAEYWRATGKLLESSGIQLEE